MISNKSLRNFTCRVISQSSTIFLFPQWIQEPILPLTDRLKFSSSMETENEGEGSGGEEMEDASAFAQCTIVTCDSGTV